MGKTTFNEAIALLSKYLEDGTLVREGNALLGIAADGEIVTIESDMSRPTAARDVTKYLAAHPTPDTW